MGQTLSTDLTKYTPGKLEVITADLAADLKKSILCKCPVPTRESCMQNNLCTTIQQPPRQISAADNNDAAAGLLQEAQKLRDAKIANQRAMEFNEIEAAQKKERSKTDAARELMMEEEFEEGTSPETGALPDSGIVQVCQAQVNSLETTVTKNQFLAMYGEDCGEIANQLNWGRMALK